MGFLTVKTEGFSWEESIEYQDEIKRYGILQAWNLYRTFKDLNKKQDELKWGEELEYEIVAMDKRDNGIKIHAEGYQIVSDILQECNDIEGFIFQPEFGSWMIEAVPDKPYKLYDANASFDALSSLMKRRKIINDKSFRSGVGITSFASFPNLGTKDSFISLNEDLYNIENYMEHNNFTKSDYILDEFTNPHPRFSTMLQSVRNRRGKKVDIQVPLYPDSETGVGKIDGNISPGNIYMDAQHFGMGWWCLQVTYEAKNVDHAKYLHDSFVPLGPIFGALSASAPIYKGQLSNWDYRWNIISASVDSRTDEEKDPNSSNFVPKSRYSTINHYISDHPFFSEDSLNDGKRLKINQEHYELLKNEGMSDRLAYHFAALFVPDSLVIYKGHTDYNEETTEHFENLNSTNWNSVRFKPPPSLDSTIGWRVEFRTFDIQITDYENAALIALLNLMVQVLNSNKVNVSLPISLSDINMERAHQIDAVTSQKFWFRRNVLYKTDKKFDSSSSEESTSDDSSSTDSSDSEFVEMTIYDILLGNEEIGNVGLFKIFENFMESNKFPEESIEYYRTMMTFLAKRAKGEIKTGARYMRDFVLLHPNYKKDSIVDNKICRDLIYKVAVLGMNKEWDETLWGEKPDFMDEFSDN